ncbi:MAG: GRAM domain-containing protein [Benjaminiella poitrasii]|nr:MAG: GRAM domain-containing protein [Benjaminiella poitrasii]
MITTGFANEDEKLHSSIPVSTEPLVAIISSTNDNTTYFASKKRNKDFHTLFRSVPEHEKLIDDYGCALQKDILVQGRLYISEHYICFNANIFGWVTNLTIEFADIESIEKKATAIFFSNAISILTRSSSKYLFASFFSRDQAYDQMVTFWKASHANASNMVRTTSRRRTISEVASSQPSKKDDRKLNNAVIVPQAKDRTECECSKNGQHFPTVVMDNTYYSTTIKNVYNLLYNSKFMTKFLRDVEKSTDILVGEWVKAERNCLYSRETSFVKYLNNALGPKSTKCYLKEEMHYLDLSNYVTQLTITQTPDVPAGGSFNVKTRTCISWSGQNQVRVLVTVLVEFTKSTWLKSTIEKASIDGQQTFYKKLDIELRKHLESQTTMMDKRIIAGGRRQRSVHKRQLKQQQSLTTNKLVDISTTKKAKKKTLVVVVSTLLCMVLMVLINAYIAFKITNIHTLLNYLNHKQEYTTTTTTANNNKYYPADNDSPKLKLDIQIMELERIIQKAEQDMAQVTQAVLQQKKQILDACM